MHLKLIACKVLTREMGLLSATSPHFIDITWIRRNLHDEPDKLRAVLQREIDKIEAGDDPYTCNEAAPLEAILLGYGLCSNSIAGLHSAKYPLIAPRAHDCITLFLGSKERYRREFERSCGKAYWYTSGWIENSPMPGDDSRERKQLEEYTELYGEENALYLIEAMGGWYKEYREADYVGMPGIERPEHRQFAQDAARRLGWECVEHEGDMELMRRFLWGEWDNRDFIRVEPGFTIQPSHDERVLRTSRLAAE